MLKVGWMIRYYVHWNVFAQNDASANFVMCGTKAVIARNEGPL